jgi:sulfopyruvate decarboxylase alpha subunit
MTDTKLDWPAAVHKVLRDEGITEVAMVPDAGHSRLIELCEADNDISLVTMTTEEEGIHMLSGTFLGGGKGVMLLQSSGVGNIMNSLALPNTCRIPILMIVTMRGEWGEFNSWQVPMGQGTPGCLEAMGVRVIRVDAPADIAPAVKAASRLAFDGQQMVAVLISQKTLGFKDFRELAR